MKHEPKRWTRWLDAALVVTASAVFAFAAAEFVLPDGNPYAHAEVDPPDACACVCEDDTVSIITNVEPYGQAGAIILDPPGDPEGTFQRGEEIEVTADPASDYAFRW